MLSHLFQVKEQCTGCISNVHKTMLSFGRTKEVNIHPLVLIGRPYCYLLQIDKHRYAIIVLRRLYTEHGIAKAHVEKLQVKMKQRSFSLAHTKGYQCNA